MCDPVSAETNCFEHACKHHQTFVGELSSEAVVTSLKKSSSDSIFLYSTVYQTAIPCGFTSIYYLQHVHIAVFCNANTPSGCATLTFEPLNRCTVVCKWILLTWSYSG